MLKTIKKTRNRKGHVIRKSWIAKTVQGKKCEHRVSLSREEMKSIITWVTMWLRNKHGSKLATKVRLVNLGFPNLIKRWFKGHSIK